MLGRVQRKNSPELVWPWPLPPKGHGSHSTHLPTPRTPLGATRRIREHQRSQSNASSWRHPSWGPNSARCIIIVTTASILRCSLYQHLFRFWWLWSVPLVSAVHFEFSLQQPEIVWRFPLFLLLMMCCDVLDWSQIRSAEDTLHICISCLSDLIRGNQTETWQHWHKIQFKPAELYISTCSSWG